MENPYATPESEVLDVSKHEIVLSKKLIYEKYRDEVKSFVILTFCSLILLPIHIIAFLIGGGLCTIGIIYSWIKMKEAKADYEQEKAASL